MQVDGVNIPLARRPGPPRHMPRVTIQSGGSYVYNGRMRAAFRRPHYRKVPRLYMRCAWPGCNDAYKSYFCFYTHMQHHRKHELMRLIRGNDRDRSIVKYTVSGDCAAPGFVFHF